MLSERDLKTLTGDGRRRLISMRSTRARGLVLEVSKLGRKTWRFRYRTTDGLDRKIPIGRWPKMKASAAQDLAAELREAIETGSSPEIRLRELDQKEQSKLTVRQFAERYLEEVVKLSRQNTKAISAAFQSVIYPQIGSRPVAGIQAGEVRAIVFAKRDQGRPAAAAALRNLLKRFFDYAMICGVSEKNPCHGVPLKFITQGKSRERTLSRPEITKFLRTLYASARVSERDKRALHLILLTLVRKSELRLAQWRHVDFERMEWEIPAEHSKTGKPHIVYLCPRTSELIKGQLPLTGTQGEQEYLFTSPGSRAQPVSANTWNMALGRVNFQMGHFTIHDLRRTAATILAEEGYPPDVIEKSLNHTLRGVRGIYNRAEYGEQRKAMLARWAEMVEGLIQ